MPMILLHGTWSPLEGRFFVWGEDAFRYSHRPRSRPAQKSVPKHPYQAPLNELDLALGRPIAYEQTYAVLLPTGSGPRPLPSPDLGRGDPDGEAAITATPWRVTGLTLDPVPALNRLATLPPGNAIHQPGPDLLYWSQVARLTLELLIRQQFLPTIDEARHGALWRLCLSDELDRRRLDTLTAGMPGICRALIQGKGDTQPPDPRHLLTHFMDTTADSLIRHWLAGPTAGARAATGHLSPIAEEWVNALAAPTPTLLVTRGVDRLAQRVQAWSAPVTASEAQPFRTCFRLDTPPDDADPDAPWPLQLLLQATDDPSLLIPAAEVWRERGATVRYLNRRFANPQERLLIDLRTAARLFPPLGALLESAQPTACALSVADAYHFLREGAPLLQASGMAVLMPAAWQGEAGLKVKARVKRPRSVADSNLGLAQILEVDWDLVLGDQPVTMVELKRLAKLKVPLVRVRGHWVQVDPARVSALMKRLTQQDGMTLGDLLKLSAGTPETGADLPVDELTAEGDVADLMDRLSGEARPVDLPAPQGLRGQLRPYQARGLSWLAFLRSCGVGACLADDMGLGKTVQVIAFLLHSKEAGQETGPLLLVCPTSLVGNWQREIARFGPSLKVMLHHGTGRLRGVEFAQAVAGHDIVISTYALVHRDLPDLTPIRWEGIILDEAQQIKNAETRQSRSLRELSVGYRIALTGTPVENRLGELWSLMNFLNPGYLGSAAEFHRRYAVPIERYRDQAASARLKRLVQPFILRRVKTDPTIIQDLPEKIDQPVYISLTPEQASLYAAVVEDMLTRIETSDGMERRGLVLAALAKLKQICNHPAHFLSDGSPIGERSGKVNRLVEMLDEALAEGDRALIFTQFAEMGQLLTDHLAARFGQEVLFLHGGLPSAERNRMVERFQQDGKGPVLFILTLKAGGVGLNLTRANHVFHFDRWWNPAVENQATDRAFRIGQQRNVMVHRMITAGTIEEKIDAMIESKRQLAEQIVTSGEGWLTELSTDQLRSLFTLEQEG